MDNDHRTSTQHTATGLPADGDQAPARPATSAEVERSQRKRLIVATADAVAERGYAGTTIEAITTRAGVSKKTFYKFFSSKEQAFLAAYETLEAVLSRVTSIAAQERTLEAKLDAMISHYLTALALGPSLTRLFLIDAMGATPTILKARARGVEYFVAGIQQLLTAARADDPAIEQFPDYLLMAYFGGINELCVNHITHHDIATLPTLHHEIRAVAQRFMLARGGEQRR